MVIFLDRLMSDYKVELVNDNMQEFHVEFHGPNDSTDVITLTLLYSPLV